MSTNVISTVATTDLFTTWANAYNQVVWELNNDVLRTERTVTGNLTSNASLSTFGFVLNSITVNASTDSTNRLENRGGVLFFNDKRIDFVNPYAIGTPVYGYAIGGSDSLDNVIAGAERITFSTGVFAGQNTANASAARVGICGTSDGTVYGYSMGGSNATPAYVATTDRTTFSTSTTAAHTPANLSTARSDAMGISDAATYGYVLGGITSGDVIVVTSDRLTFGTSITAAYTPTNLPVAHRGGVGLSDAAIYGYSIGGQTTTGVGPISGTAYKITFASSTLAADTRADFVVDNRFYAASVSDGAVYGYVLGGFSSSSFGRTSSAERLTYSTSIMASHTPANLSDAFQSSRGLSDGSTYGYIAGGAAEPSGASTTTHRLTFSTGSTATYSTGNLGTARSRFSAFSEFGG